MTAQLRQVATTATEYDGLELFAALTAYLDQLYGGAGFDRLLPEQDRSAMAREVQRLSAHRPADGETRLGQPVNAAVTLTEGRALAAELAAAGEWQRQLGQALQALYAYLDQLHGGSGAFVELLTPAERARIAAAAPTAG